MIKYFCAHHPLLKDRYTNLKDKFDNLQLDIEWVTTGDPNTLSIKDTRFVNVAEYSLYVKHLYCLEQQLIHNYDIITIFEDDIILPVNYLEIESQAIQEFINLKGDILFQGQCCNIKPNYINNTNIVYHEPHFLSRCTHCYSIKLETTKKIWTKMNSNFIAIDWKYNEIIKQFNLKSCYLHPGLLQYTETGKYKSTLR
jgi:GR25 family glycosyltransferase involved in LPS biosynthesis